MYILATEIELHVHVHVHVRVYMYILDKQQCTCRIQPPLQYPWQNTDVYTYMYLYWIDDEWMMDR